MIEKKIFLNNIKEVEKFNSKCSKYDCDMDLRKDKYYVDAKSIMGIFSLNLSEPVVLNADTDDEAKIDTDFEEFYV